MDPVPPLRWDYCESRAWDQIPDSNKTTDFIERPYILYLEVRNGFIDTVLYVLSIEYEVGCTETKLFPVIGSWGIGPQIKERPGIRVKPIKVSMSEGISITYRSVAKTTGGRFVVLRDASPFADTLFSLGVPKGYRLQEGYMPSVAPYWQTLKVKGE